MIWDRILINATYIVSETYTKQYFGRAELSIPGESYKQYNNCYNTRNGNKKIKYGRLHSNMFDPKHQQKSMHDFYIKYTFPVHTVVQYAMYIYSYYIGTIILKLYKCY